MQESLKLKSSKRGEIIQGGRVLRSIGRKDRHSKVCTARGPKDRRVRLSAHTAIQFYDVQDRLGYGRPSEAIDWLMKEAKSAIDALDEKKPPTDQIQQPKQGLQEEHNQNQNQNQCEYSNENPVNNLSFSIPSSSSNEFESLNFLEATMGFENYQRKIAFSANSTIGGYVTDTMPQWNQKVVGEQDPLLFSQGGTLQSSCFSSSSFLALMNPQISGLNYDQMPEITGNSFPGDGFSGFCVSPLVRGEEDRHNAVPNKPFSASCLLHYQD
ncbi:hypothetical protein ACSBR2_014522 [Camellia fascicularis]